MNRIVTLLTLSTIFLVGCGKPTIDTSSDEKMKSSIEAVKKSLTDDKKEEFEEAIKVVAFSGIDLSDIFSASQVDTGATERKMKDALDGKTGDEVIALAASITAEREAKRLEEEKADKAKAADLASLAAELRNEKDYRRALERFKEASRLDPENTDYQSSITKLEEKIEEERELERARQEEERARDRKVRDLLSEASGLRNDEDLMKALEIYEEALSLDGDSERAMEGIKETKVRIDEFKEREAYVEKVDLYEFEASTIDSYLEKGIPAVKFKIKNTGDKTLSRVEVTVYLKDSEGNVITEEDFNPVLASGFSFSGNNKPLKPGYIWELEKGKWYTIENAPSEWEVGNATAKITNIEFEK